jgi:hypothetical protein
VRYFAAALGALLLGLAPAASAAIPEAQRIAEALARANQKAGRTEPIILDVSLRIGDSEPLATGVLASHPTGLARLELRSHQGFVERHLLQGSEYTASRDGQLLAAPRPFLPPIFLLQAGSGAALRAALESFGVAAGAVALGLADERDCYVLGGRAIGPGTGSGPGLPGLWVDTESFEVVRIDAPDGVRFRFGPAADFDGVRAPAWISIEVPGQAPARLEVVRASRANAPAAAFGRDWLAAPSATP